MPYPERAVKRKGTDNMASRPVKITVEIDPDTYREIQQTMDRERLTFDQFLTRALSAQKYLLDQQADGATLTINTRQGDSQGITV
jgi:hypothetical protein